MAPGADDPEALVEKARYEGNYKDGIKLGFGKMVYPNGDIYEGEWVDNKVFIVVNNLFCYYFFVSVSVGGGEL